MDDKLSKIVNNLQKEGVDDSAINDVVQKVKEYWSYIGNIDWNTIDYCNTLKVINCAKFLKAKFNDETKFAIMNKTLVFRDEEICIFKPTNFNESRIIGEPICCFAYSQERWNEHYEFDQEAIHYVYDVMRYGTDEDFVAITVRPNGSALVLDKKHNWWSRHDSTRFIQGLGGGAAVITTKEGKAIKSENKEYNIYKHMNKKTIRLNESDLHRIIKESVNKVLKESLDSHMMIDDKNRVFDAFQKLIHTMIWENNNIGGDESILNDAENRYLQEHGEKYLEMLWNSVQKYTWNIVDKQGQS